MINKANTKQLVRIRISQYCKELKETYWKLLAEQSTKGILKPISGCVLRRESGGELALKFQKCLRRFILICGEFPSTCDIVEVPFYQSLMYTFNRRFGSFSQNTYTTSHSKQLENLIISTGKFQLSVGKCSVCWRFLGQ